jgi:hypothetical protein
MKMEDGYDVLRKQQVKEEMKKNMPIMLEAQQELMKENFDRYKGSLDPEGLKQAALDFGITEDELAGKLFQAEMSKPNEVKKLRSELVRRGISEILQNLDEPVQQRERHPMQDSRGRFTSPQKQAAEKAYQEKISEMKARVMKGGRLSDDELLSIMPKLMR